MSKKRKNTEPAGGEDLSDENETGSKAEKTRPASAEALPKNESNVSGEKAEEEQEAKGETSDVSAEVEGLKDRLLRLRADFDNYRKRMARDWEERQARANEDLMVALLPVLDHFELGLRSAEEHGAPESVLEGFRLLYNQLRDVLARFGLEPLEAQGQPFDVRDHEAVAHMASDEVPADHVARQVRRGYRLSGRPLRAAQVIVSSGNPVSEAQKSASAPEQG